MTEKERKEREKYKQIARKLPLIQGTIISEAGETIDVADIFKVVKSEADPQLKKAQVFYPFLRDTVILQDGKTCSLLAILKQIVDTIHEASVVYTDELRLTPVELTDDDWRPKKGDL